MNKTDKRDQAPPCLHSNEEGKREEEIFIYTSVIIYISRGDI